MQGLGAVLTNIGNVWMQYAVQKGLLGEEVAAKKDLAQFEDGLAVARDARLEALRVDSAGKIANINTEAAIKADTDPRVLEAKKGLMQTENKLKLDTGSQLASIETREAIKRGSAETAELSKRAGAAVTAKIEEAKTILDAARKDPSLAVSLGLKKPDEWAVTSRKSRGVDEMGNAVVTEEPIFYNKNDPAQTRMVTNHPAIPKGGQAGATSAQPSAGGLASRAAAPARQPGTPVASVNDIFSQSATQADLQEQIDTLRNNATPDTIDDVNRQIADMQDQIDSERRANLAGYR
jgi:hypothetical protein